MIKINGFKNNFIYIKRHNCRIMAKVLTNNNRLGEYNAE